MGMDVWWAVVIPSGADANGIGVRNGDRPEINRHDRELECIEVRAGRPWPHAEFQQLIRLVQKFLLSRRYTKYIRSHQGLNP